MNKLIGARVLVGALSLSALVGCAPVDGEGTSSQSLVYSPVLQWEQGAFKNLPTLGAVDLRTVIEGLPHPTSYAPLTAAQMTTARAMFDAVDDAVALMLAGSASVDWCAVVSAGEAAGYNLYRAYDTGTGRWLIVGLDGLGNGQHATFVINPAYRRDLVVEAPHVEVGAGIEDRTDTQAVAIFRQTAARALLMNGADRCSGPAGQDATCDGTVSSASVCPGQAAGARYRPSDVAHNDDSVFYALHQRMNDAWPGSVFVQLHGNDNSGLAAGGVSVSDGRQWASGASGLATTLAGHLVASGLTAAQVNDCTSESEILCGYRNAEGRYTNDAAAACGAYQMLQGGQRFLHVEQKAGAGNLVDAPAPLIDALSLTVACLNGSCATPTQSFPRGWGTCASTF